MSDIIFIYIQVPQWYEYFKQKYKYYELTFHECKYSQYENVYAIY